MTEVLVRWGTCLVHFLFVFVSVCVIADVLRISLGEKDDDG